MLGWMRRKREERKARLEEARKIAAEATALDSQRKEQLLQCKKNVLDILDSGNLPGAINFIVDGGKLPFKFQKSEHLLWVFSSVEYLEQTTRRAVEGRSAGVSVRVAKGVSVRVGQSRGTPVEYDELVSRGFGLLAVTTKHVYFKGDRRSLRIAFGKIVSVELASVEQPGDGVAITRDRVSGHPEFFVVGPEDAEFACDLILSVPSVEISESSEIVTVAEYHLLSHDGSDSLDGDVV